VRLVPLAAVLAALAFGAAPASPATGCSLVAAKAAVARGKVFVPGLSQNRVPISPSMVGGVICLDFTRDGKTDMVAAIDSGGTAGAIAWIAFRATPSGWQRVLARSGYKLGLVRAGSDLISTQPIYRKNDANCCPTGGFDHDRWHWDGSKLVVVRHWHSKSFTP
jgi:hypothetical protein